MSVHTFSCLDGHTCGNPVRLVSGGAPLLKGATMSERRLDFLEHHDWKMADAAQTLGIQRPNLYRKARQLGILLTRATE